MTMNILPPNESAMIKTRFAVKFVEAMKRVKKSRGMRDRYRATRAAACVSMACAVGPERAWSRAVLRKMMRRRHFQLSRRRVRRNPRGFGQEEDLRGLVPGGKQMGFCSLLTETAHYIKCLQAQVQIMTDILHCSSS